MHNTCGKLSKRVLDFPRDDLYQEYQGGKLYQLSSDRIIGDSLRYKIMGKAVVNDYSSSHSAFDRL